MKVMIGVPSYGGLKCIPFLETLRDTVKLFEENSVKTELQVVTGLCYIQLARNQIVQAFRDSDCDKLLFLDDDISFDPMDAYRLISQDVDVIAGVYPIKSEKELYPVVFFVDEQSMPEIVGNFYKVAGAPTGFLSIKREVFDKISEKNPHLAYKEAKLGEDEYKDYFDFFPQGVKNGRWVGEDFAFCELWTAAGGSIFVAPDIEFKHHRGDKAYTGNLWTFMKKQPGGVDHK